VVQHFVYGFFVAYLQSFNYELCLLFYIFIELFSDNLEYV